MARIEDRGCSRRSCALSVPRQVPSIVGPCDGNMVKQFAQCVLEEEREGRIELDTDDCPICHFDSTEDRPQEILSLLERESMVEVT
jgi:hypothetical protein